MKTIYSQEIKRTLRTVMQGLISPVLSTLLYFVVFGPTLGTTLPTYGGIPYASYIVPGLLILSFLNQTVMNASFGMYIPKFNGTIYEILISPLTPFELIMSYALSSVTKSLAIGFLIYLTALFFTPLDIAHPIFALLLSFLICLCFSFFGMLIGITSKNFEHVQIVPLLVLTPLTFLGGTFYSIEQLSPFWQKFSYFNPVVYLIDAYRFTFFGTSNIAASYSLIFILLLTILLYAALHFTFHTGYKIKK